jgi:hypothetical protein
VRVAGDGVPMLELLLDERSWIGPCAGTVCLRALLGVGRPLVRRDATETDAAPLESEFATLLGVIVVLVLLSDVSDALEVVRGFGPPPVTAERRETREGASEGGAVERRDMPVETR